MNSQSAGFCSYSQSIRVDRYGNSSVINEHQQNSSGYRLSRLTPVHINEVVSIHLKGFPDFFLSFLGPRFLCEFYGSFLVDPQGIGFVALGQSDEMLGVIVGPLNPDGYFRRLLKRRWWAFCIASIGAMFRRPSCVPRLFRALFYRGEAPSGPPRALLSSIVVSPRAQGKGVGKALVKRWAEETHLCGSVGCYLTTDAHGNDATNTFYKNLGWRIESSFVTPEGRRMNRYIYDF